MRPFLSASAGAAAGAFILAAALWWTRTLCLPVSSLEPKWQCGVTLWIVALAYLAACFVAAFFSRRGKLAAGVVAALILFPLHTYLPLFGLVSFGKRWYVAADPLFFALLPATLGVMGAIALTRHGGRHAGRRGSSAQAQ